MSLLTGVILLTSGRRRNRGRVYVGQTALRRLEDIMFADNVGQSNSNSEVKWNTFLAENDIKPNKDPFFNFISTFVSFIFK